MIISNYSKKRDFNDSYLQGFLHALAVMNIGVNHGCDYEIFTLKGMGDAKTSFMHEFGNTINARAKDFLGAYRLEELAESEQTNYESIKKVDVNKIQSTNDYLMKLLHKWFFEGEYSYTSNNAENAHIVANEFISCISKLSDLEEIYQVEFDDGFVECDNILIKSNDGYIYLSLGWTD